jgi:hypothetical protein
MRMTRRMGKEEYRSKLEKREKGVNIQAEHEGGKSGWRVEGKKREVREGVRKRDQKEDYERNEERPTK